MGAILIDFQNIHKRASLFFIPARIEPEIYVQLAKSINEISFVSPPKRRSTTLWRQTNRSYPIQSIYFNHIYKIRHTKRTFMQLVTETPLHKK